MRKRNRISAELVLLAALAGGAWAPQAAAATPDWLRQAAAEPRSRYPEETKAVVLLDEQITTVRADGEIYTLHRRAYRILRPEGRTHGTVVVHFGKETRITSLRAWAISAQSKEYETKDKEGLEVAAYPDFILYADNRARVLRIPGADPGSVIGYEYEQKERPYILQDTF